MRKLNKRALALALLFIVTGCLPYFGRETIKETIDDVARPYEKEINIQIPANRAVYKRKVSVKGEIDKKCIINLVELGPGKIDTVIYKGDHYGTNYYIKYEPLQASEGQLTLEVTFYY